MGGLDVLRWIQDHHECQVIPTMICSHSRLEQDVKQAYQLGANAYFYKPSATEDLEKLVKVIMDFWQLAEVPPRPG
jgi:CheY-like chemotaxis protein